MNYNYFDYTKIPDHMMENIKGYVEKKEELGGFLYAIFTNDLFGAVARADATNLPLIPVYVNFIWNQLPQGCHGNEYLVEHWLKKGNENE